MPIRIFIDGYVKIGLNQASLNCKAGAGLVLILCHKAAQEVKNREKTIAICNKKG